MSTVLLIVQLIISLILTGLILIQRSEGGALGIGGGGGGGGFMSGRSAANSVSRWTAYLGAAFIANCLLLSIVFNTENQDISLIDDSNAVQSLTIDTESGETTNPLADEAVAPNSVPDTVTDPSDIVAAPTPIGEDVVAPVESEAEGKPEDE